MKKLLIPESALDELSACATRATGLMYLMAFAASNRETDFEHPPTREEQEGIMWISMDTGFALKAAVDALGKEQIETKPVDLSKIPAFKDYEGIIPGLGQAARDFGVGPLTLYSVVTGEREDKVMLKRWKGFLRANPQYIQPDTTRNLQQQAAG